MNIQLDRNSSILGYGLGMIVGCLTGYILKEFYSKGVTKEIESSKTDTISMIDSRMDKLNKKITCMETQQLEVSKEYANDMKTIRVWQKTINDQLQAQTTLIKHTGTTPQENISVIAPPIDTPLKTRRTRKSRREHLEELNNSIPEA